VSSHLPCAIIVKDAFKADAEAVMTAYRGMPVEFIRAVIASDTVNPTSSTPPTHWLMFDASTSYDNVSVYLAFADNDLPPLADPSAVWGQDDLIDAAAAMTAVNATNMQVYAASGDVVPTEFIEGQNGEGGLLRGRGLMYRPEEI